jgi:hypothetical protein
MLCGEQSNSKNAECIMSVVDETWGWSIGGMVLTGTDEVVREKLVLVLRCSPQLQHGLSWDRNQMSTTICLSHSEANGCQWFRGVSTQKL